MRTLRMMLEDSLNEAKKTPLLVESPEAESEISKVAKFGVYNYSTRMNTTGKIIIGYTNDGPHFMIKPNNAQMLDTAENWLVSEIDFKKMFRNSKLNELYVLYAINKIDAGNRVRGVLQSNLVFYAGIYGELFNTKSEAIQAVRRSTIKKLKVCQIKDVEALIKKNETDNASWNCVGLRFVR